MIRLVVADDHPIVRAGLHRIVADCPDMEVVGETDDGNTLLDVLEATDADIVLLDIAMPGLPFLDLLKLLRERWPRLRTLIVSTYSEDQYAVRALRAGAAGYLTKQRSPDELAAAVRRVYRLSRWTLCVAGTSGNARLATRPGVRTAITRSVVEPRTPGAMPVGCWQGHQGDSGRVVPESQNGEHLPCTGTPETALENHG